MDSKQELRSEGNKAIDYINNKYGITFEPLEYEVGDFLSSSDMVKCTTDGLDKENEQVNILVQSDKDGKTTYKDNYFGYYIREQLEEYHVKLAGMSASTKIFFGMSSDYYDNDLVIGSTVDDLFEKMPGLYYIMNMYVAKTDDVDLTTLETEIEAFAERLKDSGRKYSCVLNIVSQNEFDAITRYGQSDFKNYVRKAKVPDNERFFYSRKVDIDKEEGITWLN